MVITTAGLLVPLPSEFPTRYWNGMNKPLNYKSKLICGYNITI